MGWADEFQRLLDEGKIAEARAMLEEEKVKAKFAPDEFIQEHGRPAVLKRRGRLVVPDKDGNWKLKNPPWRSRRRNRKGLPEEL